MTTISYTISGWPPEAGRRLAERVLAHEPLTWSELTIDVRASSPSALLSGFFNGFLQHVFEGSPGDLDAARSVRWRLTYDFQRENAARWMKDFEPQTAAPA